MQIRKTFTQVRYRSHHLVSLTSSKNITELLQRTPDELGLLPQVGGQVSVCVADSDEGGLEGVLKGLGRAGGGCVDVVDTGKLEETLDGRRRDETSTTGSRNELGNVSYHPNFRARGLLTRTETEPHLPDSLVGRE